MKHTLFFLCLIIGFLGGCGKPDSRETSGSAAASVKSVTSSEGVTTVYISGDDRMKFSLETFTVKSGDMVRIIFENKGKMPKAAMGHNVVFLVAEVNVNAFVTAASKARNHDYIPVELSAQILAHTKLLGPGERDTIEFTAPDVGEYAFICSFPAHLFAGMRGMMTVEQ